ncbi:MAG: FAD-dependent thymidylate synthase [Eubacteriales bacterium]|nr:FAD-dependent thymidylate synthase [Eubacteriales bacterium]
MEISVIATTHPNYQAPKKELDRFGGMAAGVCYMAHDFATLHAEDESKTFRRVEMTKTNGHHSVYDHATITLYLHCIPRVLEGMLDNERYMVSSVKSGRYTLHPLPDDEQKVYDKWLGKFETLIRDTYQTKFPQYFTDSKIKKLAMENARYLTSCFTMVSMLHTVSYRQLNYLYGFFSDYAAKIAKSKNPFEQKLHPYIVEFVKQLESTGYVDELLIKNGKNRQVSMFREKPVTEYFGDVYATNFRCSFAVYMHLNRHRTLKYYMLTPKAPAQLEFYVPELIADKEDLRAEWLSDLDQLRDHYPQAMLVDVSEMGNLEDFILKAIERKCSSVLLETTRVVNGVLNRYQAALAAMGHDGAEILTKMQKGAKCTFPNFKCPNPCGFALGVNEKRKI